MSNCSNCIEIDSHIFGLYSIVGFMDQDSPNPIDGAWDGIVYIRSKNDFTSTFPNKVKTAESNTEDIDCSLRLRTLSEPVLVANDLRDKVMEAYFSNKLLLLELVTLHASVYGKDTYYKAISSILPYSSYIISKTVNRE